MDSLIKQDWDIKPAHKNARDFFSIIFKHILVFITLPILVITAIIVLTYLTPKKYDAFTELRIEESNYKNIGITGVQRDESAYFSRREQLINSEINIVKGSIVLEPVAENLNLHQLWETDGETEEVRLSNAMRILAGKLDVKPKHDSWVITITVTDSDPKLAADIANEIAQEYIKKTISLNTLPEAAQFYEDKLVLEQEKLDHLQTEMKNLKLENAVVNMNSEMEIKLTTLDTLEKDLTTVRTEMVGKQARIDRVRAFQSSDINNLIPIPEIATIRVVEDLNYRLVNMRLELNSLRNRYTDEETQIQVLLNQISEVEGKIRTEVAKIIGQEEVALEILKQQQQALQDEIDNQKQILLDRNKFEATYNNLEREIADNQQIISDLHKKYTDSLYAGESDTRLGLVRQISPAEAPLEASSPNMRLNLLFGIPLALFIGLAAVVLLDYLDHTLSTPDQVAEHLKLPVLASVNMFQEHDGDLFIRKASAPLEIEN